MPKCFEKAGHVAKRRRSAKSNVLNDAFTLTHIILFIDRLIDPGFNKCSLLAKCQ